MKERHGVIVGISGASGAAIGARILSQLAAQPNCDVHLVVSPAAERTLAEEVGPDELARLKHLAVITPIRTWVPASRAAPIQSPV